MKRQVLLGDEAVALGAAHAGLSAGYSYPGTPASEIMEALIRYSEAGSLFTAAWAVNEKVAYEEALGVSFAGKRALVSFKHVGLNVAADPFMNSAMTGANGGLVVVSADDPGMHSSQNEQDSRYYARFAKIFCYEPSDNQEAYEMTREAFDISEKVGLPVLIRLVTRLSHSRSPVETGKTRKPNEMRYGNWTDWTLLPVFARKRYQNLLDRQEEMVRLSEESRFNILKLEEADRSLGVITSGVGFNYLREVTSRGEISPSFLKIGTYPLPLALVSRLMEHVDTILVAEDGYPFIENQLKGLFGIRGKKVIGRLTGAIPAAGELTPDSVRAALGLSPLETRTAGETSLAGRPPQLCAGCPHADTFNATNKVLESYPQSNVFSDIGCYTLGALPPYNAVQACVCMGASIGMAKGAADVGVYPSVAVIGDSTFIHSGITSLLEAAAADTDMTVMILDNATVAMTGGQPSYGTGARLFQIIEGLGVTRDHIRTISPLPKNLEENTRIIREEIEHRGLSVIVAVRECIQQAKKRRK